MDINSKQSYSLEEVIKSSEDYFKGDTLAATVWAKKYANKSVDNFGNEVYYEKTPEDMHHRLARAYAKIESKYGGKNEMSEEEIFKLFDHFKYIIPQGSPMSAVGTDKIISTANCFVIGNEKFTDSYGGIMRVDEMLVQLSKRRAGVGTSLDDIRPKNMVVNNSAGTAPGVVVYMERYSNTIREVSQNNRRGALMLSINVQHPDVEDFIDAKIEEGKVTGANISIQITDDFMEAVKADSDFELRYPINSTNPKLTKVVKARDIWNKIVHNAWKSAEPGVMFWDTVINESVPDCYSDLGFNTVTTNPCLTGETIIATADGRNGVTIKQLSEEGNDVPVYALDNDGKICIRTMRNPRITGYNKPILKLTLENNHVIRVTENHKFRLSDDTYKEAKDLKKGDSLFIMTKSEMSFNNVFPKSNSNSKNYYWINTTKNKAYKPEHRIITNCNKEGYVVHHKDYTGLNNHPDNLVIMTTKEHNEFHKKDKIGKNNPNYEEINDFKTYIIINKLIKNNYDVLINENDIYVKKICETCHNEFWVPYNRREVSFCSLKCAAKHVTTTENYKKGLLNYVEKIKDKAEQTKHNQVKAYSDLKFELQREPLKKEWEIFCKQNKIPIRLNTKYGFKTFNEIIEESETFNHKVVSIEFDGYEDVYNGTVDEFHNFFSGYFEEINEFGKRKFVSFNQLQCGEIPLNNGDSCRLTACNLSSYVVNPFTENAYFDFDLFKTHIYKAMRLMDDLVDIEEEHIHRILNKIKEDPEEDYIKRNEIELWEGILAKLKQGRRAGLGITAEGDMLAMMNLTYGTKEANEFAEEVQKQLCLSAYRSSVDLANERGAFPMYDYKREINNPFILRIKEADKELYEDMVKFGRRNIACLTIAPTGSVSILTETTSGVEPLFMPAYKRRRKINSDMDMDSLKDKDRNIIVDEVGDRFEEYIVYHPKLKEWMELKGYDYNKNYSLEELNQIVQKSPYYKATSSDVDWLSKVDLQGRLQKWVDHSISVTVNLPEDVSEELISDLYFRAWETGCKGLTVYREGSRNGVLVSLEDKNKNKEDKKDEKNNKEEIIGTSEKEITPKIKIKRPFELNARIVRFQNNKEKWIAFVGLRDDRPYEIFTGIDDEDEGLFIPKSITEGKILKIHNEDGTKRYDFVYKNKKGIETIVSGLDTKFNPEFWNYAIFISGILRYQMPIEEVVKLIQTLDLNDDNINTWKNGVVRALKKYIPEGVEAHGVKCPECGQETLVYQEGCLLCTNCGMSKCG